jgi:YbbR domain-containing protein
MIRRLWKNLGTFLLAMALALLVWIVALNQENPIEDRAFGQPVPITLLNTPADMILTGAVAKTTQVTIRAPRLVWQTLSAKQIRISADLGNLGPGAYTLRLESSVDADSSRVISMDPPSISVALERSQSRACPISVLPIGTPALGYAADQTQLSPSHVILQGPASAVSSVTSCVARISVDGLKQDFTGEVSVEPIDASGNLVSRVSMTPNTIQAKIPITQKQGFRDVTVKVVITGQLASGYQVTNISVTPLVITLSSSDPALVQHLPGFVETAPLDIGGASADVVRRVPLQLPPGLEGAASVLVEVNVSAIQYSLTIQRPLETRGLLPGLAAVASPDSVDVLILGPLPVLDSLTLGDVRVVLDLTGLAPGTYQITPQVQFLSDKVRAENVLPSQIEVVISAVTPTSTGSTPTPTRTETPTVTPTATRTRFRPTFTPSATPTPTPTPSATPAPN